MNTMNRCQSCGMPLGAPDFFGTNKNGSKNKDYCKFCFVEGDFTEPKLTIEGMVKKSVQFMTEHLDFSQDNAQRMSKKIIPKLKRWKK